MPRPRSAFVDLRAMIFRRRTNAILKTEVKTMVWSWHEGGPVADREAGLYISDGNGGRDDFFLYIRKIENNEILLSFEAVASSSRDLSEIEKAENPGYGRLTVFSVVKSPAIANEIEIIKKALLAWCNRVKGYASYRNGYGIKSLFEIKLIDHLVGA